MKADGGVTMNVDESREMVRDRAKETARLSVSVRQTEEQAGRRAERVRSPTNDTRIGSMYCCTCMY